MLIFGLNALAIGLLGLKYAVLALKDRYSPSPQKENTLIRINKSGAYLTTMSNKHRFYLL